MTLYSNKGCRKAPPQHSCTFSLTPCLSAQLYIRSVCPDPPDLHAPHPTEKKNDMEKAKTLLKRLYRAWNCFSSNPRHDEEDDDSTMRTPAAVFPSNPKSPISSTSEQEGGSTSVVLCHGAFQSQYHYHLYLDAIRNTTELDRVIVPTQSSAGPQPPANCFEDDVANINAAITAELRSGRDVLIVAHSYGGVPGCEALVAVPESPAEHDGMAIGRILGIVFVSAFVAEQGQSLITSYNKRADWVRIEVCSPTSHICVLGLPADGSSGQWPMLRQTSRSDTLQLSRFLIPSFGSCRATSPASGIIIRDDDEA